MVGWWSRRKLVEAKVVVVIELFWVGGRFVVCFGGAWPPGRLGRRGQAATVEVCWRFPHSSSVLFSEPDAGGDWRESTQPRGSDIACYW